MSLKTSLEAFENENAGDVVGKKFYVLVRNKRPEHIIGKALRDIEWQNRNAYDILRKYGANGNYTGTNDEMKHILSSEGCIPLENIPQKLNDELNKAGFHLEEFETPESARKFYSTGNYY